MQYFMQLIYPEKIEIKKPTTYSGKKLNVQMNT